MSVPRPNRIDGAQAGKRNRVSPHMVDGAPRPAPLPPTWGLLPFAALTLAVVGGVEALVLGTAPLSQVWPLHVVMVSASGVAIALPVYFHVSRYKRTSEIALVKKDEALARMDEYIVSASDSFPHGLAIFDGEQRAVFHNRAMREMFGGVEGRKCQEYFRGECACAAAVNGCNVPLVLTDRVSRKTLTTVAGRDVVIDASWIRSPGGKEYVMEVFTDVTDLETARRRMTRMEAQVQQADKLATLGQLAAEVAHEMNTPLASISLLAELAEAKTDDPDLRRRLGEIRRQVEVAAGTTRGLLDFVRTRRPELETVDVNAVVREAVWFTEQKRSGSPPVALRLNPRELKVIGDPKQLQQVLINLIVNAFDATADGGEVAVSTSPSDPGQVEVKVVDSGIGMDEKQVEKAFEPFFTTKGERGTGLGLAVCREIVERHRGSIRIDSLPGKGTTVTLLLSAVLAGVAA